MLYMPVVKKGKIYVQYQHSKIKETHFWYSVYYELTASICFEHYLLIFRRRYTNNNLYVACVLLVCLLAATRIGVELVDGLYLKNLILEYICS
jgi:hypothetical protein